MGGWDSINNGINKERNPWTNVCIPKHMRKNKNYGVQEALCGRTTWDGSAPTMFAWHPEKKLEVDESRACSDCKARRLL